MSDYDLTRLSTRSFEQLIQAIAVKALGPGTVIFGDGPDGAREATFEGRPSYPSPDNPWDGYIVVQAKFRQRPQGSQLDAKWILSQLTKELRKFVFKRRRLRKPDYYIFCTNLVLTAAQGSGSKDRVYQLLESYRKRLDAKGFAIWDNDQIRAFLDAYPAIRDCYGAWTTPGDVLAKLIQTMDFVRPDFERVMSTFLQKEMLADQYVNLEQAGHSADERTSMARVFIDLPVAPQPLLNPPEEEPGRAVAFIEGVLQAGEQRLAPSETEFSLSRCPTISSHSERGVRYSSSDRAFRGERG